MSRGIVVGSVVLLACIVAAAYASSGPALDTSLQGKYAVIFTSSNQKLVMKVSGIEKLGDRSFIVSMSEDANRPHTRYIPVDSINSLDVYDSLDAATGKVSPKTATVSGVVTLRGEPLIGSVKFHSSEGLAYPTKLNDDGTYEIRDIPPGPYVVTVDSDFVKAKFKSEKESELKVDVKNGKNPIDFSLD